MAAPAQEPGSDTGVEFKRGGDEKRGRKQRDLRSIRQWRIVRLLYTYPKNEQENLTAEQLRVLSRLVREEFG